MTGLDIAVKKLFKKEHRFDISPIVSGVMIALFLPASAPLWLPIVTAIFATAVKFGCDKLRFSISHVAVSLILSFLLFPGIMNAIPEAGRALDPFAISLESFRAIPASPLEKVLTGFLPDTTTFETFFGLNSARIGEISGFLIAIGFIYLLIRKTVKPILPLTFIITVGVFAYLDPSLEAASDVVALDGAIYNVFGSNTFLTAVFLMSEPKRTPKTLITAVFCGALGGVSTMLLRGRIPLFLTALIAVVLIDVLSPIINRFIKPTPFGGNITPQKEEK
jgi:electron transport complex protein RnfD